MKFGKYDFNPQIGSLTWPNFRKFFNDLNVSITESPEEVFEKLGGKLPKKKKEKGGE